VRAYVVCRVDITLYLEAYLVWCMSTDKSFYRQLLEDLKQSLGNKCVECGKTESLILHHIDKNRNSNSKTNFTLLCRSCHAKKHGQDHSQAMKHICTLKHEGELAHKCSF